MIQNEYYFRAPEESDIEAAIAIHCDPRTNLYRPGGPPSIDEAANYIPEWMAHWKKNGVGYWSLVEKQVKELLVSVE